MRYFAVAHMVPRLPIFRLTMNLNILSAARSNSRRVGVSSPPIG